MREHLDHSDATRFTRREMSGQELLEADEHLRDCVQCRTRLAAVIGWTGGVGPAAHGAFDTQAIGPFRPAAQLHEHLNYDQLAGYMGDTAGPQARGLVERHIVDCFRCRTELEELTQFAKDLPAPAPTRDWRLRWSAIVAKAFQKIWNSLAFTRTPAEEKPDEIVQRSDPRATALSGSQPPDLDLQLERYGSSLLRWARALAPSDEPINLGGIVHDTLLLAQSRHEPLQDAPAAVVEAYLRYALLNRMRDFLRSKGNACEEPIGASLATLIREPWSMDVRHADYEAGLKRLQPSTRTLIVAILEGNLSFQEMADKLGHGNANATRAAYTRALRNLEAQLKTPLEPWDPGLSTPD
ncbi:MAG TPA: hypothetical protein VFT21_12705, partial [Gemmatimonadaceae bacterium]|nr:hypothetical protein [Gemmatimonadaceae bacterium]